MTALILDPWTNPPRPSRELRAGVDAEVIRNAHRDWPEGPDKISAGLEALWWLKRYGVPLMRALEERVDAELLDQGAAIAGYRYDASANRHDVLVRRHTFAPKSFWPESCDACGKPAGHPLHDPPPSAETVRRALEALAAAAPWGTPEGTKP